MDQRNLVMHQVMLGDRIRLDAYDKALSEAVTPGAIVADVGAGTLALTALALRHGAAHVYAIEADPQLVAIAAQIIEASGWSDRVTLIAGDARTARLPQKVDVLVAELMGNLGPEEDMSQLLRVLARRSLRPGGVVIPERLEVRFAPIELDDEGWVVWRDGFLDMRLDAVRDYVEPAAQLHFFNRPPTVLGAPATVLDTVDGPRTVRPDQAVRLTVERPGCLHAIAGYFVATLVPGVCLSNFPSYPGCNWAVWVWPLRHTRVTPGDSVGVRIRLPSQWRLVTGWRLDCALHRHQAGQGGTS